MAFKYQFKLPPHTHLSTEWCWSLAVCVHYSVAVDSSRPQPNHSATCTHSFKPLDGAGKLWIGLRMGASIIIWMCWITNPPFNIFTIYSSSLWTNQAVDILVSCSRTPERNYPANCPPVEGQITLHNPPIAATQLVKWWDIRLCLCRAICNKRYTAGSCSSRFVCTRHEVAGVCRSPFLVIYAVGFFVPWVLQKGSAS